ncbi:unnamed protein product [Paramecium octaurelia]|uniref:Uncharacterized protein n=1 Tax=Paramecium octaurelia TaxID=43137 RepID=A0A8S1UG22_PAROT|nr:unnamed protein product [Paramecium octaurelia]
MLCWQNLLNQKQLNMYLHQKPQQIFKNKPHNHPPDKYQLQNQLSKYSPIVPTSSSTQILLFRSFIMRNYPPRINFSQYAEQQRQINERKEQPAYFRIRLNCEKLFGIEFENKQYQILKPLKLTKIFSCNLQRKCDDYSTMKQFIQVKIRKLNMEYIDQLNQGNQKALNDFQLAQYLKSVSINDIQNRGI